MSLQMAKELINGLLPHSVLPRKFPMFEVSEIGKNWDWQLILVFIVSHIGHIFLTSRSGPHKIKSKLKLTQQQQMKC